MKTLILEKQTTFVHHLIVAIFFSLVSLLPRNSMAQCVATTAHSATIMVNDNSIGDLGFINPTNISNSDNVRSSAAALVTLLQGDTYYLKATGFNFNIPSYASICGVVVEIESRAGGLGLGAWIQDNDIRLVKNGVATGDNMANLGVDWPGSESYHSYGSANDMWGTTLTYADVSASNFGVAISAKFNGLALVLPSAQIDHVRITIYYNPALPTRLISFSATKKTNTTWMEFKTADEEDGENIILQRSNGNSFSWQDLSRFEMKSGQSGKTYRYQDILSAPGIYYYRLKITNVDGHHFYSETKQVHIEEQNLYSLYPNPANDFLYVTTPGLKDRIPVYSMDLKTTWLVTEPSGTGKSRIDISSLPKGLYFLKCESTILRFVKQ